MQKQTITQEELKQLLSYDPETGVFVWNSARRKGSVSGETVGYIHHSGYRYCEIKGKHYAVHRVVWLYIYGEIPDCSIDHIDGDRRNNRLKNLRLAKNNHADNGQNRKLNCNSSTGFMGVSFQKSSKKYVARISKNKISYFLGEFSSPEEASLAYKKAKKELHTYQPVARD